MSFKTLRKNTRNTANVYILRALCETDQNTYLNFAKLCDQYTFAFFAHDSMQTYKIKQLLHLNFVRFFPS